MGGHIPLFLTIINNENTVGSGWTNYIPSTVTNRKSNTAFWEMQWTNTTTMPAWHPRWHQNKTQTHQPASCLPPTHTHTQKHNAPHLLCLKQSRQWARKHIFKPLSRHLAAHCLSYCCTDPTANSKHLWVCSAAATGPEKLQGGGWWVMNTLVSLCTDQ